MKLLDTRISSEFLVNYYPVKMFIDERFYFTSINATFCISVT